MSKLLEDVDKSKRVVAFLDNNTVRWKGFKTKDELFWWLEDQIFRSYDNPIFQNIRKEVNGLKADLTIDEQIEDLEDKLNRLKGLKSTLH